MEITSIELQNRWTKSWEAWQDMITKFTLSENWYRAYEQHLRKGEDWSQPFRFPELFGAVQRKADNLLEFMPESKPKGDGAEVIALTQAMDAVKNESNLERERRRAIYDAVKTGIGCVFVAPGEYKKKVRDDGVLKEVTAYNGLIAERIDPRDVIPAYSALVLHDHTGQQACPYLFRRKIYYYDSFFNKYGNDDKFKNVDQVRGSTYSGGFSGDRTPTQREGIEKQTGEYVTVIEYWDQENDIFRVYADHFDLCIFDSKDGIPYSHKQLPFHFYYNYRREDSITGVGEIELRMPYNLFRERIMNLQIDNIVLELQPAYIIDGDLNFNSEETELEAGAVFTVRGLDGGKLQDSIMPFRAGGVTADVGVVVNTIDDSMITVTGDDTRSLYANPDQLATQTLAKREALQKRIRSNVMNNTIDTEYYLNKQIVSYLQDELARPYKNKDGKTVFRKIKVQGYHVSQDKKESEPAFEKAFGANDEFYLNKKIASKFEEIDIEMVPAKLDDEIKRDRVEKLMMFMQQIFAMAQTNPQVLGDFDLVEFIRQLAQQLGLDIHEIYPPAGRDLTEIDVIAEEHEFISLGEVPPIKPEEDSMEHFQSHIRFMNSAVFKKLGSKAKEAMNKHILLTLENVKNSAVDKQIQAANAGGSQQTGGQGFGGVGNAPAVQGMGQPPQEQASESGTGLSPQAFAREFRAGEGQRPA